MKMFLILLSAIMAQADTITGCDLVGRDSGGNGSYYYRCSNQGKPDFMVPTYPAQHVVTECAPPKPEPSRISAKELRKKQPHIAEDCWRYIRSVASTGGCYAPVGRGHDRSCVNADVNELNRLGYEYANAIGGFKEHPEEEPGDIVEISWCGQLSNRHFTNCWKDAHLNEDGVCVPNQKKAGK